VRRHSQAQLRVPLIAPAVRRLREQPQCHDIMRCLLQVLQQQVPGRGQPIVRERDPGVVEFRGIGHQAAVRGVGAVPRGDIPRGEVPGGEFAPAIRQAGIEAHRAAQRCKRLGAATGSGAGATELELHDGGVRAECTQSLEHTHRGQRIPELAVRGGEQQLRLGALRRLREDLSGALGGGRGIRVEQRRRAHQRKIDRGRGTQRASPVG
jgi:hypothetical protein